jgi:hypothetical protein
VSAERFALPKHASGDHWMERADRELQSGAGQKTRVLKDRSPRWGRSVLSIGVIAFAMSLAPPSFASPAVALGSDPHWVLYFEKANGDRHFFHEKSLKTGSDVILSRSPHSPQPGRASDLSQPFKNRGDALATTDAHGD